MATSFPNTVTLLQLRNQSKAKADMSGSAGVDGYIPDPEWNDMINSSIAEWRGLMTSRNQDYYLLSSGTTLAGSNFIPYPSDFAKLRMVEKSINGSSTDLYWHTLRKVDFGAKNSGNDPYFALSAPGLGHNNAYYLTATGVNVLPPSTTTGVFRVWYDGLAPTLNADADSISTEQYFHEYVTTDVAAKALAKGNEPGYDELLQRKTALVARIDADAAERDFGEPEVCGPQRRNGERGGYGGMGGYNF